LEWVEGNKTNVLVEEKGMEIGLCERTRGCSRNMFGWEYVRGKMERRNGNELGVPNESMSAFRLCKYNDC
jgi:hypothetical protein